MAANKAVLMAMGGPPVMAGVRGFVDSRYPEQGAKVSAASKLIMLGSGYMAYRGGKHALKWFILFLIFAVPEGYTAGEALARR